MDLQTQIQALIDAAGAYPLAQQKLTDALTLLQAEIEREIAATQG